jgi:hypothetical protein
LRNNISRIGITYGFCRSSTNVLEDAQDCYDADYEDGQDFPFDAGANDFCKQFTDYRGNMYFIAKKA